MSMHFWRAVAAIGAAITTASAMLAGPSWLGMISMWIAGAAVSMVIASTLTITMREAFHEMLTAYTMMKKCNDAIIKMHLDRAEAPPIHPDQDINRRLH